jgi:SPOR domain
MTDIYQSPGDRLRFEILLKSLTEGGTNLAVLSEHDMVLDYYGSLFEERLRAKGESHVEFCASTNSERLVQKFNEILSEITLDQALEKDKKHAPRRFLLFRDSILMQDFELQLLARLVNGFPAGNISVILLINSAADYDKKLKAFGKNLIEWEVETKAGEPKTPLRDWVATEPEPVIKKEPTFEPSGLPNLPTLDDEVTSTPQLLNLPTKTAWRIPGFGKKSEPEPTLAEAVHKPIATPAAAPVMPEVTREPELQKQLTPVTSESSSDDDVFVRAPRKSPAGLILLALLLSMAAFGFLYKDQVVQEANNLQKYLLKGTPAPMTPDEAASAASAAQAAARAASEQAILAAEATASAAASAASQPEPVASDAASPVAALEPASQTISKVAAVQASAAEPQTKPDTQSKSESKVKAEPKPEPKPGKADAKAETKKADKTAKNASDAWVSDLPDQAFILQLAALDSEEEMLNLKRANPAYAKTHVLRTRNKDTGKRFFILVAGPFASKADAQAFMKSDDSLSKGWLRTTKSLKNQFAKS